jgi:hypothetical protein
LAIKILSIVKCQIVNFAMHLYRTNS